MADIKYFFLFVFAMCEKLTNRSAREPQEACERGSLRAKKRASKEACEQGSVRAKKRVRFYHRRSSKGRL